MSARRSERVAPSADGHIQAVRHFNRFYTQRIGVIGAYLDSPYSLAQVRVLYELAHRERPSASELSRDLGLDRGYLSRILRDFARTGIVARETSRSDRRQQLLALTRKGHETFAGLNARSSADVGAMLRPLASAQRGRVVEAMRTI